MSAIEKSFPILSLGLTPADAVVVLRVYFSAPGTVRDEDARQLSAVFEKLPPDQHGRLHAWAMGVLDGARSAAGSLRTARH